MPLLGRGAGDKDRRERHEWATLDHDQKLGSALSNYARAKEAVWRARAHKELANHALDDAHVDGFGPRRRRCATLWPNVEKVIAGMPLPNTTANNIYISRGAAPASLEVVAAALTASTPAALRPVSLPVALAGLRSAGWPIAASPKSSS